MYLPRSAVIPTGNSTEPLEPFELGTPALWEGRCLSQSSLFRAAEARLRLKAGRTEKITERPFVSFCPYPQRRTRQVRLCAPWSEWATKCGKSSHSCPKHCCSGIELSRRDRERFPLRSRVLVRFPQTCCS